MAADDRPLPALDVYEEDQPFQRQSQRNLLVCYYLTVGRNLQSVIGLRDFLDIYLYDVSGTNEFVGKVETTTGTLALLVLIPLGYLIDKVDRLSVLKASAALKLVPTALILVGTQWDSIALLWPGLMCLSMVNAALDLTLQVVMVDNVPEQDQRILMLSRKEFATWASSALGPLLVLVVMLFQHGQGGWSLGLSRTIIQCGLLLYIVTEPAAFFVKRAHTSSSRPSSGRPEAAGGSVPAWAEERVACVRKRWLVPIWADVVWAATQIGACLSLRYIPLFFRSSFGLSPAALLALRVAENGSLAGLNYFTPGLTRLLGRGATCVVLVLLGGLFMYGVAAAGSPVLAAALFVLRTCTARAWLPPLQSIIFECVAPEHRGRWSAVTSFKSATNGVGAWVGGLLADRTGSYRDGFLLTATVQVLSAAAFLPVACWLPRSEASPARVPLRS